MTAIGLTLTFSALGLALLAAAQMLATWRADLMEGRRRLRSVVLIGTLIYYRDREHRGPVAAARGFRALR
jgi:uncharacterized membrane protein